MVPSTSTPLSRFSRRLLMPQSKFQPQQAVDLAEAFHRRGVDYLFIGKSGAILLGYPAITQDVDLHVPKNPENGRKIIAALEGLGFPLEKDSNSASLRGKPRPSRAAMILRPFSGFFGTWRSTSCVIAG